jgi:hypothetical protein
MTDPSQFYPQHIPSPAYQATLQPLTGAEYTAAWQAYQMACKRAYYKGPLPGTTHLIWFLAGLFTFGLGWIGWIIHVCVGQQTLRPGAFNPQWPPPGYYVPKGQRR